MYLMKDSKQLLLVTISVSTSASRYHGYPCGNFPNVPTNRKLHLPPNSIDNKIFVRECYSWSLWGSWQAIFQGWREEISICIFGCVLASWWSSSRPTEVIDTLFSYINCAALPISILGFEVLWSRFSHCFHGTITLWIVPYCQSVFLK